ncbi:UDP-N-acetylmuramate dehydrogenase [Sphingomonas solaris]|uniref:UDP-N-acetylmuramate dehydrogenase n=1 Tax=Alterirhizorhabdus solaris TaxID=2529389 RepID=UPI00193AC0D3|nr:UDP-N-acetylmuramate dehydrogenase [Sphingomonas solaris]
MTKGLVLASSADPLAELKACYPDEVGLDVPLSTLGRWRIGGPADAIVTPRSAGSLADIVTFVRARGVRHVIVGDGSNILFDDAGFRGAVIRIGRAVGGFAADADGHVRAGAGLWVPGFVRRLIDRGLTGAVHAIGIPGTLGGLVVMNGGSQRRGIGEHVTAVNVLTAEGEIARLDRDALAFAYRSSRLQENGAVVLSAEFRFEQSNSAALRREAIEILASRRAKFPKVRANCGSVFVSDPKLYALIGPPGMAIERAGLKGLARGDARISPEHANFIVNTGQARSADVLALIAEARTRVHALTGVAMEAEVRHLDPYGRFQPAHMVAPAHFQEMHDDGQSAAIA